MARSDLPPLSLSHQELAETISCGGNLLLNVGPTHDGRIVPIFEERLRQMGHWLGINGDAVYASGPWSVQNDTATSGVWYTQRAGSVYAIVLDWPPADGLVLASVELPADAKVLMLGYGEPLQWTQAAGGGVQIKFPELAKVASRWAWVLQFDEAQSAESNRL